MNRAKLKRSWGAVKIRYPVFTLFTTNRKIALLGLGLSIFLISIVTHDSLIESSDGLIIQNDYVKGLVGFVLELILLSILAVGLLIWKTISSNESNRINEKAVRPNGNSVEIIDSGLTIQLPPTAKFVFNKEDFFKLPDYIASSYRWAEFDRDEFYLVNAGSLDKPKLTLRTVEVIDDNTVSLTLGIASYYDIFFTTYSPDLSFSTQRAKENDCDKANSVRGILEKSTEKSYLPQIQRFESTGKFVLSPELPNPLGISGIVALSCAGKTKIILRQRKGEEVAASDRLEWSFAGLIEASDFLHTSEINFEELVSVEYVDEVESNFSILKGKKYVPTLIGMTINPLWLYQPELYVLVEFQLKSHEFESMTKLMQDSKTHMLTDTANLKTLFDEKQSENKLKNLCPPGLELLKKAREDWFKSPRGN